MASRLADTQLSWQKIQWLFYAIVILGGVMTGLGWWLVGAKFAGAMLIGVVMVVFNVWATAKFAALMLKKRKKNLLGLVYPLKLLLEIAIVLWLILVVKIDAVGFLVGLSTLVLGVVTYIFCDKRS